MVKHFWSILSPKLCEFYLPYRYYSLESNIYWEADKGETDEIWKGKITSSQDKAMHPGGNSHNCIFLLSKRLFFYGTKGGDYVPNILWLKKFLFADFRTLHSFFISNPIFELSLQLLSKFQK